MEVFLNSVELATCFLVGQAAHSITYHGWMKILITLLKERKKTRNTIKENESILNTDNFVLFGIYFENELRKKEKSRSE